MTGTLKWAFVLSTSFSLTGCTLREVRSITETGVEYRQTNSDKSDLERYSVEETVQFKWDNDVDTSVSYRRRDLSDSLSGDHDDGVWFEVDVPLWKAPKKPDDTESRIKALESRIARLENALRHSTESEATQFTE